MSITLILLAACSAPNQAGLPDMTVAQIEERILASRRQIRRGKLSFEMPDRDDKIIPYTVWFDQDKGKYRADSTVSRIRDRSGPVDLPPYRRIVCRNCERENHYVEFSDVRFPDGKRMVLELRPLKKEEKLRGFDPRLIGFIPNNPHVLAHDDLETVVGKGERSNQTLRQERLGEVDCYVIAFDTKGRKGPQRWEYWAAPSRDYMLLRVSVTNTNPDHTVQGLVENELAQYERGDIWFPRTSTYKELTDGKISTTVTLRVKSAEFNGPPDNTPFTLAGMNLPEGTTVDARSPDGRSKTYTWKNEKLTDYVYPRQLLTMPPPPKPGTRWWLYVVAGVLAVLALASLGLYWRRRVATT